MTANPEPANAMTTPLVAAIPEPATVIAAGLTPAAAWSRRARRIGGFTQAAFAALWLARASLAIGIVATGLAAGILLLGAAAAGFHDLAGPKLTAP